nr:hypothetical protein [Tanacetum cinerariifolium]
MHSTMNIDTFKTRWPPKVTLERLLPHARGLGFKPRREGFPSGEKKQWGLSPKAKVRVLRTAQLDVTKDAPSSVLTRSGRKRLTRIQASTNPVNTRKSPRFQKHMGPTPSAVDKKTEKSKKLIGSTPLRRSERGKNPIDVHVANVKSTENSADISKESAEEGSRDSIGGSKKRKTYHAVEFKARKSPRFLKQTWPTPSTPKKKPETSEKQMGSTTLRRFER